jgi:hypothetical protein
MIAMGEVRKPRARGARKVEDRRLRKSGQSIHIPEWVHDVIRDLSDETGESMSALASQAIETWVRTNHTTRVPEDLKDPS